MKSTRELFGDSSNFFAPPARLQTLLQMQDSFNLHNQLVVSSV
jgi:hypothetical protein